MCSCSPYVALSAPKGSDLDSCLSCSCGRQRGPEASGGGGGAKNWYSRKGRGGAARPGGHHLSGGDQGESGWNSRPRGRGRWTQHMSLTGAWVQTDSAAAAAGGEPQPTTRIPEGSWRWNQTPPGSIKVSAIDSDGQPLSRVSGRKSFPSPTAWFFPLEMLLGVEPGPSCRPSKAEALPLSPAPPPGALWGPQTHTTHTHPPVRPSPRLQGLCFKSPRKLHTERKTPHLESVPPPHPQPHAEPASKAQGPGRPCACPRKDQTDKGQLPEHSHFYLDILEIQPSAAAPGALLGLPGMLQPKAPRKPATWGGE